MAERADAQRSDTPTHRHERPEDWGWHAAFGKWARIAGWIAVAFLLLNNVTTYYNTAHAPWLFGVTALLAYVLIRDHFRRKNAWRS